MARSVGTGSKQAVVRTSHWTVDSTGREAATTMTTKPTNGSMLLPDRRDPSLTVRIVDGQTGALLSLLVSERIHLILGGRLRPAVPEGVQALGLYDDPMQLVVSRRHPLARAANPSWARCVASPWVLPPVGHPVRSSFDRARRSRQAARPVPAGDGLRERLASARPGRSLDDRLPAGNHIARGARSPKHRLNIKYF